MVDILSVLSVLVTILAVSIVWCMIRLSKIEEFNRMCYRYIRSMDKHGNKNTGMVWSYTSIEKSNPYYTGIVDIDDEDNSN